MVVRVRPAAVAPEDECIAAKSTTHVECLAPEGSNSFKVRIARSEPALRQRFWL